MRVPVGLACLTVLAFPAAATAATVTRVGSIVTLTAGTGKQNNIGHWESAGTLIFNGEAGEPANEEAMSAQSPCTMGGPGNGYAMCDGTGVTRVDVFLGDRDDYYNQTTGAITPPQHIELGPGNDKAEDSTAPDEILGEDGNDIFAPPAVGGGDSFSGGAGSDTVDYSAYGVGVIVTPGTGADDGAAGEGDSIGADVENVIGTEQADDLTGGAGPSTISARGGNDTVRARDGAADTIDCGTGSGDTAIVDHDDTVTGCENVDRAAAPQPTPTPTPTPAPTDKDGDLVLTPADCDDSNPAVKPGATDVPGNGIDEDCKDGDAARGAVKASVATKIRRGRFTALRVTAPRGARVTLRCRGRRCPGGTTSFTVGRSGKVSVFGPLKGHRLGKGAVVELTITLAGFRGVRYRYTVRPPRKPRLVKTTLPSR